MRRSVYCTASFSVCSRRQIELPIIYADFRLDYKLATLPRGQLRTLSEGQMLSAEAVITHSSLRETSRQSPYADRFLHLQILARDPAGNQYT